MNKMCKDDVTCSKETRHGDTIQRGVYITMIQEQLMVGNYYFHREIGIERIKHINYIQYSIHKIFLYIHYITEGENIM